MSLKNPLSQSLDRAVKNYASLFTLPTGRTLIMLQALICIGGGTISLGVFRGSLTGLTEGLLFGGALFMASLLVDYLVNLLVLRRDSIYDLRRTAAVSLFCWGVWFFFSLLGTALGAAFGFIWWVRLSLFGFSIALILRMIIYTASSSIGSARVLTAACLHPLFCLLPFLAVWTAVGYAVLPNVLLFLVFSSITAFASTHLFLSLLNRVGEKWLALPSLSLFRAFLLNWIVGYNAPFEELLERLGEEQNIEVSLVKFDSVKPKAAVLVPAVHPGPFKNIGSSVLPSLLKSAVEKQLKCTTCVPLGVQGHERDLASQSQNQKVIQHAVEAMDFEAVEQTASPLVEAVSGFATVHCQIFGPLALLSFTLAPYTTEDLPQELGLFIKQETEKNGLSHCIVVNSHNSLDEKPMPEALTAMKEAAAACLRKAVLLEQMPFEVGASTVLPKEYTLIDGMGAGGVTAIVVRVGDQKAAYVVIDGNNIVSGLREKILAALVSIGISEGEVFTTDTHSVSAVVLGKRGYHPVGEVMNHEILIGYIKEATQKALSSLEQARAGYRRIVVPNVKVIGEKRLESLSLLTDRVLQRAKKTVAPIFATSGLLLMLFSLLV